MLNAAIASICLQLFVDPDQTRDIGICVLFGFTLIDGLTFFKYPATANPSTLAAIASENSNIFSVNKDDRSYIQI